MPIYFTKDHEWIDVDGSRGRVGITDFAQGQLGDVVYVELPPVGKALTRGGDAAVVESVKAASEVYSPVTGTVTAVNTGLPDEPSLVNSAPRAGGWFFEVELSDLGELDGLLDEAGYEAVVARLED